MDNEQEINQALTVTDLLKYSYEQKPIDFEQAFNSIMVDRLASAIDDRKVSIAQRMFGGSEEQETDEVEDQEDLDYEEVDTDTELSGEEDNG
jgi:hypothetical protein